MFRVLALTTVAAVLAAVSPGAQAQVPCVSGSATLNGVTYACSGVDLMAVVTPQQLGTPPDGQCIDGNPHICANDVWGWTDPTTGHEVALVGLVNGLAFVDVTIPTAPVPLGRMPTQTTTSTWRDVEVYADHAFVVSEADNHGMQVFDLRRLRGLAADPARTFTADAVYSRFGSAHTIAVNPQTGFAYPVGFRSRGGGLPASCNAGGAHVIDVRVPTSPVFSTCFTDVSPTDRGYTHDMVCQLYAGPDADYTGHEICLASDENEVTIFDVTDKTNVRIVSRARYPGFAYTHQGWFAAGQRFFLVNDEIDEFDQETPNQRTIVMDFADLDSPEYAYSYMSGLPVIDHNLYVVGRYAFESNYQAGLRILDLDGVATGTITETAFFDTYPQEQDIGFAGQWSNYPFFASGIVVANDMRNGLFVLRPTALVVSTEDTPAGAAASHTLSEPVPNPTSGSAKLTLSVGTAQTVTVAVYDVTGRRVATAFAGPASPGTPFQIDVDTSALTPGVYVVRADGASFTEARQVTVIR